MYLGILVCAYTRAWQAPHHQTQDPDHRHGCIYMWADTLVHTHIHATIYTHVHTPVRTRIHATVYTYVHTLVHTHV